MTTRYPAGCKPKLRALNGRRDTRTPTRPAKLRQIYEDDDDAFDVPDAILGSGKE